MFGRASALVNQQALRVPPAPLSHYTARLQRSSSTSAQENPVLSGSSEDKIQLTDSCVKVSTHLGSGITLYSRLRMKNGFYI